MWSCAELIEASTNGSLKSLDRERLGFFKFHEDISPHIQQASLVVKPNGVFQVLKP